MEPNTNVSSASMALHHFTTSDARETMEGSACISTNCCGPSTNDVCFMSSFHVIGHVIAWCKQCTDSSVGQEVCSKLDAS
jgi:hypothetical protein